MIEAVVSAVILCNNLNWTYSERCTAPVEHFEMTENGWKGYLTSGVTFTQTNYGEYGLFQMENVRWIVTPNGIIYY